MLQASHHTPWFSRLRRRELFHSPPCSCGLTALLVLLLSILASAVSPARADDRPITANKVPVAQVDPRPIKLPVIDGNDIRFKRLSTAEGLSQTRVANIVQDDQGFMWFGTQYGLNRYDGYKFKVFKHDPGRPNSLSGVYIYSLFKDRSGTLWIGCDQFLDRFDPTTETFTHYRVDTQDPKALAVTVFHISQDRAGMLWLATGKGLRRLDPATGRITHYLHDPNDPSSLSSNDVKSTGEDKIGTFWVATGEGLDAFDRDTGKVALHIPLREPVREFSFYEDRFGVFWIAYASGGGLAVFDRKTNRLTRYVFSELEPPSTVNIGVYAMLEDRDGTLWLGTRGAGLLKFDRERRRFIRYRNSPGDPESLAEDRVTALFEDREGNIWTALHAREPNFFASKRPPFEKFPHNPNNLGETLVNSIYEDRHGILWSGSRVLNRIDRKTGQYTSYRPPGPGGGNDVITIIEDRSGVLWVGTVGQGLKRFDRRTGQFKAYRYNPADPSSLSNNIVARLLIDHTGTLWAATWDGLNRFDPATERFTVYKPDAQSRAQTYIEIAEDRQGALWLGSHYSGLHRFDPATGQFTIYKHNSDDPGTLSDNRVNSVYFDRSGAMWAGTQNGLDKLDPKTGRFTVYYERDGLPGNAVSCILEDERGDLWMSTNKGLSRFDPLKKTFKNYSAADGLPGADLTGWGACFKSPSGEMFFGGFSGATAFHPDKVVDSLYVPPVVLTDFRLFGSPVEVGAGSPLKKSITSADALTLSHEQNSFSLAYSALSYFNPTTHRYRSKLEGLDREWNEAGNDQRIATYTTLPPGDYTFRVQSSSNRGVWNEPGAALRVEILPPWWSTWWFRATYGALILFLVWSAYYYRLHQITRQFNLRLEERVGERTRIARELHDTLLQGFLSASMQLHVATDQVPVDSPAKPLLGRVLQLMGQVIEEGRNALRGLRSAAGDSLDLEQAFSRIRQELAIEEPIDFRVIVEGRPRPLHPVIRDEVYRVGREALVNAFRHSGARSIEVELEHAAKHLQLMVRDNGCGIDPQVLQTGRDGHWGLSGMRERAEKMGARLNVRSRAAAGTEVELCVPSHIAFQHQPPNRPLGWLARIYPRKKQNRRSREVKRGTKNE
jgi:ligand-binding sensor domain-containing protein/signal transduction histidine kinase